MRLLYLSCHAVLEYDELRLFEELGIDYFSLGSYIDPQNPVDAIRPALKKQVDPALHKMAPVREAMPKEFIDLFDVIIIMHIPEWVFANWDNMKHKRVILRTIGQNTPSVEARLQQYKAEGLEIVRYSPKEANIPGYAGSNAMIRFYKDPEEFKDWNPQNNEVITMAQNMRTRGEFCHFEAFREVTEGLNAKVYGPNNEDAGELNGGFLTYEQMRQKYRESAVYVYTGTQPASYTLNFMEAWMTGIPIVSIGSKMWNSLNLAGDVFEVPELLGSDPNWPAGYFSNYPSELRIYIETLLNDPKKAHDIGAMGRKRAIELFGMPNIMQQWKEYLRM